jgi:lipid II:glycine glycyltransferase (peptidoglycan interpeptide bridge formation enzyme)
VTVRVLVSDAESDDRWDSFVESVSGADHLQSTAWGRVKSIQGWKASRIVVEVEGEILGGAQLLARHAVGLGALGYVPRGPVVAHADREIARVVVDGLCQYSRGTAIRHLVVQPARHDHWLSELLPSWGFAPGALSVAPTATVVIDLEADPDEVERRMSRSVIRHARKGRKSELAIREGDDQDLHRFHDILAATGGRQGYTPHSLTYYRRLWEVLSGHDQVRLFLAEVGDELVSAQLVVPFSDVLVSKVSAWSGEHRNLYANETLELHVIEWARRRGLRYYDMEGIDRGSVENVDDMNRSDPRSPDAFKLKFGGEVVLLPPAFDYFPNRLVGLTWGRLYRLATSDGWLRPSISRLRTWVPGSRRY